MRPYAVQYRTGRIETALQHVNTFHTLYPPSTVSPPPSWLKREDYQNKTIEKDPMSSTRVSLLAEARPLVRLSSPIDVVDTSVSPLLLFKDVELLHHRLVWAGRIKDIGRLKYITKCYETALRRRRGELMK